MTTHIHLAATAPGQGAQDEQAPERYDVVVIGAGLSGIGAAHYLTHRCPEHSFVVLDAQNSHGGTWLTHQYPGARSDSDLYTYGYAFKPWTGAPIATREEIRRYMKEVIDESQLRPKIRYGQRVTSADWCTQRHVWTLQVERLSDGQTRPLEARFLWMCQGYYRHDVGYVPNWPGMDDFRGRLIHPQHWPDDLDCTGKRVVVVGSGATAATLLPALAGQCASLTLLQRSPTYFAIGRNAVPLADELRALNVDETWIHEIVRRKLLKDRYLLIERSRHDADRFKHELLQAVREHLPADFDVDAHFNPRYKPWSQRIAFDPDGGLFKCLGNGSAQVVTDEIDSFTTNGLRLKSGQFLDADIVVSATGFHMSVMGDIPFSLDGVPLDFAQTVAYRGVAFTGVPNLAWTFGYYRASWTLRVDLVCDFVCRWLTHMRQTGAVEVSPQLRPQDSSMELRPFIDPEDFSPGYIMRGIHRFPRQGTQADWRILDDYLAEKAEFAAIDMNDPIFHYCYEHLPAARVVGA